MTKLVERLHSESGLGDFMFHIFAISVIGCLVGLGVSTYTNIQFKKLYKKAESYAVRQIGDRQEPLTESEKVEWYGEMNVKKIFLTYGPTERQLRQYIRKVEDLESRKH
jgi:hypothetical protein